MNKEIKRLNKHTYTTASSAPRLPIEKVITNRQSLNRPIINWKNYLKKEVVCFNFLYKNNTQSKKVCLDDFKLIKSIGKGRYGIVILVLLKSDQKLYAMKVLIKEKIVQSQQIQHAFNEKIILQAVRFPFIIHLEFCFKDNSNLYFVMPYMECGELYHYLKKVRSISENDAKFYAGQMVLALEYLHYLSLVYRDLKPENILIDAKGYLKLTDFGFCKLINQRTYSLCGTEDYMAPEIILRKGHFKAVDWWTLGILIYEMCAGQPPFIHSDQATKFKKICEGTYCMPPQFSTDLKDLVSALIEPDISKRLGNLKRGVDDIKNHIWFKDIYWLDLLNKKIPAPHITKSEENEDIEQEELYISEDEKYMEEFENF